MTDLGGRDKENNSQTFPAVTSNDKQHAGSSSQEHFFWMPSGADVYF
jgi:hypothetical protein